MYHTQNTPKKLTSDCNCRQSVNWTRHFPFEFTQLNILWNSICDGPRDTYIHIVEYSSRVLVIINGIIIFNQLKQIPNCELPLWRLNFNYVFDCQFRCNKLTRTSWWAERGKIGKSNTQAAAQQWGKELTIHFRCKSHIIAINENFKLVENCYHTHTHTHSILQISISSFQLKTCNCEIGVDKLIWFKCNSRLVEVINKVANVYKHECCTGPY